MIDANKPAIPPSIPDDPKFLDRPAHATSVLAAVSSAGGDFTRIQTAQSVLLAPLNLRFLIPILKNLTRLHLQYPAEFSTLTGVCKDALKRTLESYDILARVDDPAMMQELSRSPRDSVTGNLHYATGRHPLYSLLMLEHPHPTSSYFDIIVAATISKAIALRDDFSWENYGRYIHPESRLTAVCPQPLNSVIARVEFLARGLTSHTNGDPLSKLADSKVPLDISAILDFLCKESMLNGHSKSAVRLAEKVDSFLHATSGREGGRRGSSYGIREGINLGTLIAGPLEASAAEQLGATFVSCTSSDARQEAADLDMVPEEISSVAPTLLLDLGIGAGLPASARTALSRHIAAQIARVQQLMPTRDSGLRPHRLQPVDAMMSYSSISPSVALLLRTSLACGRPISALERMAITVGASVDDADDAVEFDVSRETWRIRVNTPSLRTRQAPAGARPTSSHAELPDVVGAVPLARAYHSSKGAYAERITLRWTPAEHEQAAALLKSIRLDADFLGRLLPMALYQATGDLATGALIGKWLPNGSSTYLHYLTVERRRIAARYWRAAISLKPALMLPMSDAMPPIEPGFVGMQNCPSDQHMRTLVSEMISELQSQHTATTGDRARYINLLSTYTTLFLTQGLGLRNAIDPDPDVQKMPPSSGGLGLAKFSDKLVSSSHIRVLYCPAELTEHVTGLAGFTDRVTQEFPAVAGNEAPGLLPFITEGGQARCYHPGDVSRVLGARFPFMPNALRRRARSRMYDYGGEDAVALAHGFSAWMGHWTDATNPHRPESGGVREALRGVATQIIGPLLREDGWLSVPPRI